jgi:8-oxo-dGTP pyrophosphatase MutT (NUDIX family)
MIKKLTSKTVYKNAWMTVREDEVEFPNKHQGIYGVVDKSDFALIIPYDGTCFHLVKQFRYPIEDESIEFPQGKHENDPSAEPSDLAKAELQEETGLISKSMKEIGFLHEAPGYSSQGFHIFFATDLVMNGERQLDITESGLETITVTPQEFEEMVKEGKITDAPTISAFALLKMYKIV